MPLSKEDLKKIRRAEIWYGDEYARTLKKQLEEEAVKREGLEGITELKTPLPQETTQEPTPEQILRMSAEQPEEDVSGYKLLKEGMGPATKEEYLAKYRPEEISTQEGMDILKTIGQPEQAAPLSLLQQKEQLASKGLLQNPYVKDYVGVQEGLEERQGLEQYATRGEMEPDEKEAIMALLDAGRYDDVVYLIKAKQKIGAGYGGGGSVGASLRFGQENPEKVARVKGIVNDLRKAGGIDEQLLLSWEADAEIRPDRTINAIQTYLGNIKGAVQKIEETRPGQIKTSYGTSAASTAGGIETKSRLADVMAETAGKVASGTEVGKLAGKYEAAGTGLYDLSDPEIKSLKNASMAIDAQAKLANMIEEGNVDFFDLTPAGKIKNPEAYQLSKIVDEYYARPLSGAAINDKEWKQFKSEVLSKSYLLTPEGKKAAIERLRDLAAKENMAGSLLTKDDDWWTKIKSYKIPEGAGGSTKQPRPSSETEEEKRKNLRSKYRY